MENSFVKSAQLIQKGKELEKHRPGLAKNTADTYNVSTVKKTISGIIQVNESSVTVEDIRVQINNNTKYKNVSLSILSTGMNVRVKGYFVDRNTLLASSIEKIENYNRHNDHDMQIIAALLLLKYKN